MMYAFLDYETRSPVDIRKAGLRNYAKEAQPILAAWAFSENPFPDPVNLQIQQWDYFGSEGPLPQEFREMLVDPEVHKTAFNSPFEIEISRQALRLPALYDQWSCTMAWAYSRSFFGGLAQVGAELGLPESLVKAPGGVQLIRRFCVPRKPSKTNPRPYFLPDDDPGKWEQFVAYNRQDVLAEASIRHRLHRHPWTQEEWYLWRWDRKINDRGLPVDLDFLEQAIKEIDHHLDLYLQQLGRLTGLDNPNSRDQLLEWLRSNGVKAPDLQQKTVEQLLENPGLTETQREVLRLRLATSQAATKKYLTLFLKQRNGRIHDTLQIWGAGRTGRWAGRDFQLQNLKRPLPWVDNDVLADLTTSGNFRSLYGGLQALESLGGAVRSVLKTPDGYSLVNADLSSIESRFVGWLTNCRWINNLFSEGKDSYKAFASIWLGVPYDQVTKEQRNLAKPPFLGFAYRLGWKGLITYAESMGVELNEDQSKQAIETARDFCPEIVQAWYDFEEAAHVVLTTGKEVSLYKTIWRLEDEYLTIELPSGRKLWYYQPRWEPVEVPWGGMVPQCTYMGQDQFTKQWTRLANHGGRFIEQITQAGARDVLVHGMMEYDKKGGWIIGHVHDEVLAEEDEELAPGMLETLNECLSKTPEWAPGLLLRSEGMVKRRFGK